MTTRSTPWLRMLAVLLAASTWAHAETGPAQAETTAPGAPPELNESFIDPDLDIATWVERFESESREIFTARHEVLQAVGLQPGSRVTDVGAGTGLYTRLFAGAVGSAGWVYAVEISPRFLEHINQTSSDEALANVTAVLGRTDDITLPSETVDVVFLCDTYHHFEAVEPIMASIRRALVPGGTLVVIDFERIPGESREWTLDHVRAGKEVFRAEIEAAGFAFVAEVDLPGLEENYFLKFKKE